MAATEPIGSVLGQMDAQEEIPELREVPLCFPLVAGAATPR